ncbi:MAG: hypothetical protein JRH13_11495 [Deltaproteobacteria bacterium]|nr:hypothetical protein [Deltaproteobacteria bacterium]MBW2017168.1 hypothetical protein [Deltaproteobacteria bacterium]MBW2129975.1 hypothetical protein [Deltaproteobacteria bacterium]MBW2302202.1 hypothetical protein [Deltaproteobacteria bacterium]
MTPFSFEWQWNIDYLIFMGFLYLALTVVVCGLIVAYIKSWMDVETGEVHDHGEEKASSPLASRRRYAEY